MVCRRRVASPRVMEGRTTTRGLWTRLLPSAAPLATMGMAAASSAADLTVLPADAARPSAAGAGATTDARTGARPLVYGSSMRSCAVCLDDYLPGDRLRMLQPCNHCFHQECIDAWLRPLRNALCPVCNARVSLPPQPDTCLPAAVQLVDLSVRQSWLHWLVDLLKLYYHT